jgi:hypothetical protein
MQLSAQPPVMLMILILFLIVRIGGNTKDHEQEQEQNYAVLSACFTTGTSSTASATFSRNRRPHT